MYPENSKETQIIVGSMNTGYDISNFIQHCQDSNSQHAPSQARANPLGQSDS